MNILITNDDGPQSYGLALLRHFAKRHFKEANTVVLVPTHEQMGRGMSIRQGAVYEDLKLEEWENNCYHVDLFPADLIYLAFCQSQRLIRAGSFNVVLCGVNLGANVGWDVFHSGTVGSGMVAATLFNAAVFVFSQDIKFPTSPGEVKNWPRSGSEEEKIHYAPTEKLLPAYLQETVMRPGECTNVNFPTGTPVGWASVPVANYSRWRDIPELPILDKLIDDIQRLKQGYVTISELELRVNPSLRY